jgi:hypothetical protein
MRIGDGKNSDPGWKKFGSGIRDGKIRIQDKHPVFATLLKNFLYLLLAWVFLSISTYCNISI